MSAATPQERALVARIAAHSRWAHTSPADRKTAMEKVWSGRDARFYREVDPEGILSADEREARVANAKSAHYARLALRSAQVRRDRSTKRRDHGDVVEPAPQPHN